MSHAALTHEQCHTYLRAWQSRADQVWDQEIQGWMLRRRMPAGAVAEFTRWLDMTWLSGPHGYRLGRILMTRLMRHVDVHPQIEPLLALYAGVCELAAIPLLERELDGACAALARALQAMRWPLALHDVRDPARLAARQSLQPVTAVLRALLVPNLGAAA
ncbi:hypothetical protein IP84_08460 [beta proteobacterium AAP99]|nr:hypothetical protein IP84_08460 [beta proteobacterium AAP99]